MAAYRDRWGHQEELLATIAEELDALIRVTIRANADPKKRLQFGPPFSYPRPGRAVARRKVIKPADLARRLLAGR